MALSTVALMSPIVAAEEGTLITNGDISINTASAVKESLRNITPPKSSTQ
jgi:hypothetical protein